MPKYFWIIFYDHWGFATAYGQLNATNSSFTVIRWRNLYRRAPFFNLFFFNLGVLIADLYTSDPRWIIVTQLDLPHFLKTVGFSPWELINHAWCGFWWTDSDTPQNLSFFFVSWEQHLANSSYNTKISHHKGRTNLIWICHEPWRVHTFWWRSCRYIYS